VPIWTFLRRDKSPTPTGIRTSDHLARSLVNVLSALSVVPMGVKIGSRGGW
jgi:hypothetical protein